MRTILVDDEEWSLCQLEKEMERYSQIEVVGKFTDGREALAFAEYQVVEFAFLDVEMPYINGIELGRKLRERYPEIILIYLTGYEQYLRDAILDLKADFYLLKPYDCCDIEGAVKRAISLSSRLEKRVKIQTFGAFEVYIDKLMVHFQNRKAKELLALCIFMEGNHVTMERAVDTLWEERPFDSKVKGLYRKAVIYLNAVFRDMDVNDVFENGRGYCCIRRQNVNCDYFSYLEGDISIEEKEKLYSFLPEYSWADGFFGI